MGKTILVFDKTLSKIS